jgi:hypothetical protein
MPGVPPHLTPHLLPRSAAVRLCLLAALAAGVGYVAWFWRPLPADLDAGKARGEDPQLQARAPTLDPEILAQVRDDSRSARLQLEAGPLQHLLERALDVGPAAAQALGMPEQPVPLAKLRAHAANWRGHWLGYRGRIVDLSGPRPGHPNAGYGIYEATLQLDDGGEVLFLFSRPPGPLAVGSVARAEGFLLKLRDTTLPRELREVPLLVGSGLQRDFAPWPKVTALDADVLRRVVDTERAGDLVETAHEARRTLDEDQEEPLWHLAAFARDTEGSAATDWERAPLLDREHTWPEFTRDAVARGTPMRVQGIVADLRRRQALPNPAHVQQWTDVWLQVAELGGKAVPVWIPAAIQAEVGAGVCARAFYYRRFAYESRGNGQQQWTPLFVAAGLDPVAIDAGAGMRKFGWFALGGLALLTVLAYLTNRQLQRASAAHDAALAERRRRRRQAGIGNAGGP